MKPQTQKSITLEQIAGALATLPLADARALLAPSVGATMTVSGTLLKIAKRIDVFRLIVLTAAGNRPFEVFANFTDPKEQERFTAAKIRKNSQISLAGKFASFGSRSIVMNDCKLLA